MLKKGLVALVCIGTMTAIWSWAATTWQLQTKLSNGGGTLKVRTEATQTVVGSVVYKNFTTSAPVPVTITANSGYKISGVTRNGAAVALLPNWTTHYSTSYLNTGGSVQSLVATFAASATGGGGTSARTWQMQTKLNTAGGQLKVQRSDTPALTAVGTVSYKNYTTHAPVAVQVDANVAQGYAISGITQNGTALSIPAGTTSYTVANVNNLSTTVNSLIASFALRQLTVTTSPGAGGTMTPTNPTVAYGGGLTVTVAPSSASGVVAGITVSPAPTGLSYTDAGGLPVTLPYYGQVKVNMTGITANTTVSSTFTTFTANAGADQVAAVGQTATLYGSSTGGGTYLWSQVSGPAVTLSGNTTLNPTFVPTVTGSYVFRLSVYSGANVVATSTTTVSASTSVATVMRGRCQGCHDGYNVASGKNVFQNWSASTHKASGTDCVTCHTKDMPGPVNSTTVDATTFVVTQPTAGTVGSSYCSNCHAPGGRASDFPALGGKHALRTCADCHNNPHNPKPKTCGECHFDANGQVPLHPIEINGTPCLTCHVAHTGQALIAPGTHYNTVTTGMYPASYVTSNAVCADCHNGNLNNSQIRNEWSLSGHAATNDLPWIAQDFKTMSGCVQCHSTTGFIAYSTGKVTAAWGVATDYTKEVLTCKGCHSDVANGILRNPARTKPYPFASYTTPEAGKSNVCIPCHTGRNNGAAITARLDAFTNSTSVSFVDPHGLGAAGTLYRAGGYRFPGRSYTIYSTHQKVSAAAGAGPCVSCHKPSGGTHLFTASAANPVCSNCHTSLTDPQLATAKGALADSLTVLRAQLQAAGYTFNGSDPAFSNTNWGHGVTGANTMGVAMNYKFLVSEPGAYAHDPTYVKQLLADSIDFMDNGSIDGSITTIALPGLVSAGTITSTVADNVANYLNTSNQCLGCHNGTVASGRPMASNGHAAHLTSAYGPGEFFGTGFNACQTCHVYGNTSHLNRTVDLISGAGSDCAKCHGGTVPTTWAAGTRLDCTTCHGASPAVLPNGVAAPAKTLFASKGHGRFAASNQCTSCHDSSSRHITGSLGDGTRLLLSNDNNLCASCHNDAGKVTYGLNMVTHFTAEGSGPTMDCKVCHDIHGTSNLSQIRTRINGVNITYTDRSTGWIDTVTNEGLCQVCHINTNHYKRGVPETNHYTKDCFGCHSHKATEGAFWPKGTCNSCHGYPPAPKNASTPVFFGVEGSWVGGVFEDYSGGGGAHLVEAHVPKNADPKDGWVNCAICHNGGNLASTPYHQMVTPASANIANVTVMVDTKYRFDNSLTIYTSAKLVNPPATNATGSCFNISCHMSPSPRWSMER